MPANTDIKSQATPHLGLSPHGRIYFLQQAGDAMAARVAKNTVEGSPTILSRAFEVASANGLLALAKTKLPCNWPAEFAFWKNFAGQLAHSLSGLDEAGRDQFSEKSTLAKLKKLVPPPDTLQLSIVVSEAPPMRGLEYLTPEVLTDLWLDMLKLAHEQTMSTTGGLDTLLPAINPDWQPLGRVTFHLAENKKDDSRPFAFLATYTNRLSKNATVKHLPLADALRQFAGEKNQSKLAELLKPVSMASQSSELIQQWLDSRALFRPQALSISQARQFLNDVPTMEQAGLVVRVPNWWRSRSLSRPEVRISLGNDEPRGLGADSLLDFSVDLVLNGESLTEEEQQLLLAAEEGLMLLRGNWIVVDGQKLNDALEHWQQLEQQNADGVDFLRGMRMLAGAKLTNEDEAGSAASEWIHVAAGDWLEETLKKLRDPSGEIGCRPGQGLHATLRPYQAEGVRWLWFMMELKLGACLADDMGLGKTIQIVDLLLRLKKENCNAKNATSSRPSLLIVPASLIGNWKQELARFAPQLNVLLAHRSECDADTLKKLADKPHQIIKNIDAVVTSYSLARKAEWMGEVNWNLLILDEAQAIKNAASAQTRAIKQLNSGCRIALTGTPVENQLGDLWSLFDFCCPGLLGTSKDFKQFVKRLNSHAGEQKAESYAALRRLVQPYILRRMKTDPSIAPDLPAKTEMRVDCGLSRRQATLYKQTVKELEKQLEQNKIASNEKSGIQRRGIVLSTMMRLKQICNHPSQALAKDEFAEKESGKFQQLSSHLRSDQSAAGKGAGIYPVPIGLRTLGRVPGLDIWQRRPGPSRQDSGQASQNAR